MKTPLPKKITILIVEDSPTQTEQLRYLLEQYGYLVTAAKNGREALDLIGQHKPDLVISDINMPEINGYELCKNIKDNENTNDIPIILLTALFSLEDVLEGLECGADSFITKPFNKDYLLAQIEQILANWKLRKTDRLRMGVEIIIGGKRRFISADQQQMLGLLLSSYEAAVQRNNELIKTQEELSSLNENLEEKVSERTAELSSEIVERKHAQEEVRARLDQLELIYTSSVNISQSSQPKEVAKRVLEVLSSRLNWHHSFIRVKYPEDEIPELLAFHQPNLGNESEYLTVEKRFNIRFKRPDQDFSGWVIEHGQPVYSSDLTQDSRYVEIWPDTRSAMYVPLQVGKNIFGCLSVESKQLNAFSESDEWLISTLAAQTANTLENSRLLKETQRRLKHVQSLRKIDTCISNVLNLNMTLDLILEQVTQQLEVDAADILLLDPFTMRLKFAGGQGFQTSALQNTNLRLGGSLAGRAALDRHMIHIPDLSVQSDGLAQSIQFTDEKFIEYYAVPLIAKGLVKGVLEIFHRSPLSVDQEWLDFLNTLAGQAAIAIENIALINELQNSKNELFQAYDATIEGWSSALDLRDKETEGHAQRVTEMTLNLARTLGVEESELIHIRRGALLHDIGKMGVPDEILHKPGPLNDDEWQVMRKHPKSAFDMLSSIKYLQKSLDIPYCHHEKWDGSGYPRGLKGEGIPKSARIFAVVDVWDALTSDRPYRKAWTKEKALEHIKEQSGKHFDPQVVEVFVRLVENENKR